MSLERVNNGPPTLKNSYEYREPAELDRSGEYLSPSSDLAWMLGVLAGGGNTTGTDGVVRLNRSDERLIKAFVTTGETLFRMNTSYVPRKRGDGSTYELPHFLSINLARRIGDFRSREWPNTILNRHRWILENERYAWEFLGGFFDVRGNIDLKEDTKLRFNLSHQIAANFILNLIVSLGIRRPIFSFKRKLNRVAYIGLTNKKDLKTFADNIHSRILIKEEKLQLLREYTGKRKPREKKPRGRSSENTERGVPAIEMIEEWRQIHDVLGRTPRYDEIRSLHNEGRVKFSPIQYSYHFGKVDGKFSYLEAVRRLNGLAQKSTNELSRLNLGRLNARRSSSRARVSSVDQLVREYVRARETSLAEKKRLPSSKTINYLRKRGEVSYSAQTFANYFGNGNFAKALENLERIVKGLGESNVHQNVNLQMLPGNRSINFVEEINETLKQAEHERGFQVRYVPKMHRANEDESKRKLLEIIDRSSHQQPADSFWIGQKTR